MIKVGVVGIGMMGSTHLDVYQKLNTAKVVAVADLIKERREGRTTAAGNIEGQSQGGKDFSSFRKYEDGMDLIADPDIDLIDICLPTPRHLPYAVAALKAGKHVLVEKPFARTAREGEILARVASESKGMLMCAMCMRFWPGWNWLKKCVDEQRFGQVLAAQFRRVSSHPGGPFYSDGDACGGAILDLHIHDTDFIQYCFGRPRSVTSYGYSHQTTHIDHVVTHYEYDNIPLVVAEGGWAMQAGTPFQMQYTINFEEATAVFDLAAENTLTLLQKGERQAVDLPGGLGYDHEIQYFLECIASGEKPEVVLPESAVTSVEIVEAELESIRTGKTVEL
ncbi:Gfo/Idh/MocA family oxidoreductase [Kiritimatiellaeota bacterium B1221]|nr:Gfo/Idh/MocA family oxidoreductase [Kiritimatiellaeota bacterium B1221]